MFNEKDIDDYQDRLITNQKKLLIRHCNKYNIRPNICAWYDDWEDFCSDWCDTIGYTRTEARKLLRGSYKNKGEFKVFSNGTIIRLVV